MKQPFAIVMQQTEEYLQRKFSKLNFTYNVVAV